MNMSSTASNCQVSSSDKVIMNGKVIATHAITGGRQNIGNSRMVTTHGVTFFVRPPSVSFVSSPLSAFCVMNNHRFDFAVINSCGNAVIAKPVPTPVHPKPPKPQPKPPVKTVTVVKKVPQTIVNTGPENIAGIGAVTTAVGTLGYQLYQRKFKK